MGASQRCAAAMFYIERKYRALCGDGGWAGVGEGLGGGGKRGRDVGGRERDEKGR